MALRKQTYFCIECGREFTETCSDGTNRQREPARAVCRGCTKKALDEFWAKDGAFSFDLWIQAAARNLRYDACSARKKERQSADARGSERPARHNLRVRQDPLEDACPDVEPAKELVGMD